MRLTKDESEINLANGDADPEFAEWKWASPEEVIEQVQYKKMVLDCYDIILCMFGSVLRYGKELITGSGLQEANL